MFPFPQGQPDVSTRIFQGVQPEICIVLAASRAGMPPGGLVRVRYRALPEGHRDDKFRALAAISLTEDGWEGGEASPRGPLLRQRGAGWAEFVSLPRLF